MRNKRILKELEQIIEISTSPKKSNPIKRVMLCSNSEIGRVDIRHTKSFFNNKTDSTVEDQIYTQQTRQQKVEEVEKKRMYLARSKQSWQSRQTFGKATTSHVNICSVFVRVFHQCVNMSHYCKASNRALLNIVMAEAKGERESAKKMIFCWLMNWIQHIFKFISLKVRRCVQNL